MAAVVVEGLTKAFGAVRAVDGVSLAIADGAFVALLGPSGCGKTTLLRLIAGLERPSAGSVRIGGADVTAVPPERRGLGYMFQSYALFPHMTVAENVAFPLRMKGGASAAERARRVGEMLDLVRLSDFARRRPRQLSGGQQQRVALARALVASPQVLLLDEPLSNLDARLREEMQVELKHIHRRVAITTIFVTHDQEEALGLADHVVLMKDGRIEQQGAPREIYARPASAFAADFLGAANLIEADVASEGGAWVAVTADGLRLPVAAPDDGRPGRRTVMLRQEALALSRDGAGWDAALPASVETEVFRGAGARYVVRVGALRLNAATARAVAPDDARFLCWRREDARVL